MNFLFVRKEIRLFNGNISDWDISNVIFMREMFVDSGIYRNKYLMEKIRNTWGKRFPKKRKKNNYRSIFRMLD